MPNARVQTEKCSKNKSFRFVYISWFPSPDAEELAQINAAGAGVKGWVRAGGMVGPMLLVRLDPLSLNEIRDLLKRLPPSGQDIQQHSAVVLTFQDGTGFHSRIYDRSALPAAVHRIWHLMSAPGMAMECRVLTPG
jgi:hypothetical protein